MGSYGIIVFALVFFVYQAYATRARIIINSKLVFGAKNVGWFELALRISQIFGSLGWNIKFTSEPVSGKLVR